MPDFQNLIANYRYKAATYALAAYRTNRKLENLGCRIVLTLGPPNTIKEWAFAGERDELVIRRGWLEREELFPLLTSLDTGPVKIGDLELWLDDSDLEQSYRWETPQDSARMRREIGWPGAHKIGQGAKRIGDLLGIDRHRALENQLPGRLANWQRAGVLIGADGEPLDLQWPSYPVFGCYAPIYCRLEGPPKLDRRRKQVNVVVRCPADPSEFQVVVSPVTRPGLSANCGARDWESQREDLWVATVPLPPDPGPFDVQLWARDEKIDQQLVSWEQAKSDFSRVTPRSRERVRAPSSIRRGTILSSPLDSYALGKQIGQGGSCCVWSASTSSGQEMAVKILDPEATRRHGDKRFRNEVNFCVKTIHPRIVRIHDYGFATYGAKARPFFVMTKYPHTLRDVLKRRLPPEQRVRLIVQVLEGLAYAHEKGVTHRDLKPENVLVQEDMSQAVIADFGIARFDDEMMATIVRTRPSERLANFAYAAPEQRTPGPDVGPAADVFAAGLIMNQFFTSQLAHGSDYQKVRDVEPRFGYLDGVVESMLKQEPAKRPKNGGEALRMLKWAEQNAQGEERIGVLEAETHQVRSAVDDEEVDIEIVGRDYAGGDLFINLSKSPSAFWTAALKELNGVDYVAGCSPREWRVLFSNASVSVEMDRARDVARLFGEWLPRINQSAKKRRSSQFEAEKVAREIKLRGAVEAERRRLDLLEQLKEE